MSKAMKLTVSTVLELAIAKNLTLTRSDGGTYHLHKGMLYLESFPQLTLCYKWLLEYESVERLPRLADLVPDTLIEESISSVFEEDALTNISLNQILERLHFHIRAIALLKDNNQLPKESLQQALEYLSLAYEHLKYADIFQNEEKPIHLSIHDSSHTERNSAPECYIKE
jgi:hypothetical protein